MPERPARTDRGRATGQSAQVHVVSGKGGTGKTTVAAALALALASGGVDVLLCEVEGRQGIARLFDVEPLPYDERRIATGLETGSGPRGSVYALHVDAESALLEYLAMYYRLGRAGRALDRFGVVDFATTIAPGVRDVLLTGKIYEAATRVRKPRGGMREYAAVVLDAPPTGRIASFLGVNEEVAGLARVGPIRSQADNVMGLLRSRRTRVHLVTLLEEMPVQETADGIRELRQAGLPVGHVVVNLVRPRDLDGDELQRIRTGRLDADDVGLDLKSAGLDVSPTLVDGLLAEAADHAERRALEDSQRDLVADLGRPVVELPLLPDGVDLGALYELASRLKDHGMTSLDGAAEQAGP